jgi:hypothetical protein
MKKTLLFLLMAGLLPSILHAEWVPLNSRKAPGTAPEVTMLRDDNASTVLKIDLAGFDVKNMSKDGANYQVVDLLTESFTNEPGNPELPYVSKVLAVPDQAGVTVDVIATGEVKVFRNIHVQPARASWWEGDPEPAYEENPVSYRCSSAYPLEYVKLDPPAIFRDFRIARVSVFPVRYIADRDELQVVSSITVRINYGKGEVVNPKTTGRKPIPPSFGKIYRNFIFNYQDKLETLYGGREEGRELMLCIMPDLFYDGFQNYAQWKRQSGIDIHITKFSEIGANSTNPYIIHDYIAEAYHTWDIPPTYVLAVGDDGVFPIRMISAGGYSFPNEDFFVEIDGDDYFPELLIGRWTHETDFRMQIMINKFMLYEKNPLVTEPTWFRKGTCCANNDYISQVETKRFARSKMMFDGNFISVDTLMSDGGSGGSGCTVDLQDVIDAINNGRGFLNYRGNGWYDGWHANCYYFSASDVSALNNGQKFTFVTSIGCGVAGFQSTGGNSFGEEWIEEGTMTSPKGACGFLGPTSNTHTTYNNKIDMGIYIGMFQEGLETPAEALLRGKLYMYSVFGNDSWVEYHFHVYTTLGDPSIHIWKTTPHTVMVSYPASIPVGDNQVEFKVTHSFQMPMVNAQVCVTGDSVFATGFTDENGTVTLDINTPVEEILTVTVRGGEIIPFQGPLSVIEYDVYIEPRGEPAVSDLDGNSDGLINPNEHVDMTYTLKNFGVQTAHNVQATLVPLEPDVVQMITSEPINFGDIPPSGVTIGNPFEFFVVPDCPIGQVLDFQLHITCDTSYWDYNDQEKVEGCDLSVKNYVVFDAAAPEMNFRLDPGETDAVVFSLQNEGKDDAPDVLAVLRSNDPYITILDSIGYFGFIGMNDHAENMDNCFVVSVAANCPTDYLPDFTLKLLTQNGNYPYQVIRSQQIPVGKVVPADYTGPDIYGYYAYASDDSFYEQTPVYNWVELENTGTQIDLPQMSDYTTTVSLPFPFKYYGVTFSQLRISTDGWIAFGSGTQTNSINAPLPHSDNISNMVAPFWDDLYDVEMYMGSIFYYNDVQNHRFIVEWDSISRNAISSDICQEFFEAILLDPAYYPTTTGDGEIIFQYKQLESPISNTIGIENALQNIGLNYVCNSVYDPSASELSNGLAIKFTTEPPFTTIITAADDGRAGPGTGNTRGYYLAQNQPNPFTSKTMISYTLPEAARVRLAVYNISGELVCILDNSDKAAGKYSVVWDGCDATGNPVSEGVFFCRMQTDNYCGTMKMCLIR